MGEKVNHTDSIGFDSEDVAFGHELDLGDGNNEKNGRVFLIPNLLSEEECNNLIQEAERVGMEKPTASVGTLRTAKRTKQYVNEELSKKIDEHIASEMEKNAYNNFLNDNLGEFYGTHSNWRLVRYDPGDKFPAHQDQMDTLQIQNENGSKDLCASSHTLILNISPDGVKGGNLRFYPKSRLGLKSTGVLRQYQHCVDVRVLRGWAVVFRQKGLIHAGQPVDFDSPASKYIAQAGFLRKV